MPVQNFTAFIQWVKTLLEGVGRKGGRNQSAVSINIIFLPNWDKNIKLKT